MAVAEKLAIGVFLTARVGISRCARAPSFEELTGATFTGISIATIVFFDTALIATPIFAADWRLTLQGRGALHAAAVGPGSAVEAYFTMFVIFTEYFALTLNTGCAGRAVDVTDTAPYDTHPALLARTQALISRWTRRGFAATGAIGMGSPVADDAKVHAVLIISANIADVGVRCRRRCI
jgi:hypothetical protein